jgi:hypothetical protein
MFSKKHTLILLICVELAYLSLSALISPTLPLVLNSTTNTTENSTTASPNVDLSPAKSSIKLFIQLFKKMYQNSSWKIQVVKAQVATLTIRVKLD